MQLEHKFSVPASKDVVWKALLDPERVAPCMPGATVQSVDGNEFSGTVKVKLGPVSLMYKGSGEFIETDEASNKVVIKASGKDSRGNGTAAATVTVVLTENGSSTDGSVTTDLNITGKPAQFGRGMIADVGGKILDTFASCLASKLGGDESEAGGASAEADGAAESSSDGAASSSSPSPAPRKPSPRPRAKPADQSEPVQPRQQVPQPERLDADEPTPVSLQAEQQAVPDATPQSKPQQSRPRPVAEPQPEAEAIDLFEYAGSSVAKRVAPVAAGLLALIVAIIIWRRNK